jgi:glucose/arabinose dehydrogenase
VRFQVETLASGLEAPWDLAFVPDGRILLTERPGRVRVIQDGALRPEPLVTIAEVAAEGEGGLLGIALDPNFAQNQGVYLYYTHRAENNQLHNRVVRYTLVGSQLSDPRIVVDGIPGAGIHNGGRIAFGPDGKLYVTAGDASQSERAQDPAALAGKILRLNSDGSIPSDNPFATSPVYALGLRNPQGLAWQPGTNQLYATEHGPQAHDEVNRIDPGGNYGWPQMQGDAGPSAGATPPVLESGATTWAPTGATLVQAATFAQWQGSLLFAGRRSETLWKLVVSPSTTRPPTLEPLIQGEYGRLRTVVEGPDGMLYLLTSNRDGRGSPAPDDDRLLRIAPAAGS